MASRAFALAKAVGSTDRFVNRVWSDVAFCARYGRQPLSEILSLPYRDLRKFMYALRDYLENENKLNAED